MAIPDTIEVDLSVLKTPENRDRRANIAMLLRQILFSEEVTPGPDEEGNWVLDDDWNPELSKVTMRKVERKPLAAIAGRVVVALCLAILPVAAAHAQTPAQMRAQIEHLKAQSAAKDKAIEKLKSDNHTLATHPNAITNGQEVITDGKGGVLTFGPPRKK